MGLISGFTDAARSVVATWAKAVTSDPEIVASEQRLVSYEGNVLPAVATMNVYGREITIDFEQLLGRSPESLYRDQPNLRAVVSFLARNVAQLGLHIFDRVDDTDRQRITDGPAYLLLRFPNDSLTQYELMSALMSELALHDVAYWWVHRAADRPAGWRIDTLPVSAGLNTVVDANGSTVGYRTTRNGKAFVIPKEEVLIFHGWNPSYTSTGLSPVAALKATLAEQIAAVAYRQARWDKGARVGTYLYRPADAPSWSSEAQERFSAEWRDKWGRNGPDTGGEPLLQDGMEIKRVGFSAVDDDYIEASKLSLTTVASVYHVNPVMVGLLDNANYSNVREFRKMLYGDTLGPWLAMIEARITSFLLPMIGAADTAYVEFNVAAKLAGSFEEQASVMSTMVGRPIMTANEGRAKFNLPRVDDDEADQLIVPLNVTVGGQPSPQTPIAPTTPSEQSSAPFEWRKRLALASKAASPDDDLDELSAALQRFFGRQARSVLSLIGAGTVDWWDGKRWDDELAADLYKYALTISTRVGRSTWDDYDSKKTIAYLRKLASIRAANVNESTREQLEVAIDSDNETEDKPTPQAVFDDAKSNRSTIIAGTVLTACSSFGAVEAGKQAGGGTKTWIVTSKSPRASHARMNGETVDLDERFSNGADWPGDAVLGADGIAGCKCDVAITIN